MVKPIKKSERDKIRKRHTGHNSCPVCRKFEIKGKGDKKSLEISSYTGECDAIKLLNWVESMLEENLDA
jgi:hypothetical protein